MIYAYLQGTQEQEATDVRACLAVVQQVGPESGAAAYALAAIPARYALERRAWDEAASLTLHPSTFPWSRYR